MRRRVQRAAAWVLLFIILTGVDEALESEHAWLPLVLTVLFESVWLGMLFQGLREGR